MLNEQRTLIVGERSLLVSMDWQSMECKMPLIFPFQLRSKALETGKYFGAPNYIAKDSDRELKAIYQFSLIDESFISSISEPIAGALLVAKNISGWADIDKGSTATFIKFNDNYIEDGFEFWVAAITSRGEIIDAWDTVAKDQYQLIEILDGLTVTDTVHIVHLESEARIKSIAENFFSRTQIEYPITAIKDERFIAAINNNDCGLKQYYKPSKIKIERVGVVAGAALFATTAFFGWSYMTQMEALSYFSNDATLEQAKDKEYTFGKLVDKSKPSKYWTDDEFKQVTLEQFVADAERSIYSPLEVALVIREIERNLPAYASEWKFNKLVFLDNQFFAYYSRIKTSKGVYFLLDETIDIVNKAVGSLTIIPDKLLDNGETRVYSIIPNIAMDRKGEFSSVREALAKDSKIKKQLRSVQYDAQNSFGAVKTAFDMYSSLSMTDKWFKRKPLALFAESQLAEQRAFDAETQYKALKKIESETVPAGIDEKYVLGNVMDFVTMMQLDSFFDWSYPKGVNSYPYPETLKSKTRKEKKKKSTSSSSTSKKTYSHAIESYSVTISSQETEEEGQVSSYGISDMLQLGFLINKPFVQVDLVEYDKDTQQWEYVIHFNRKTAEYTRTIAVSKKAN